jgi:hypothetical protein
MDSDLAKQGLDHAQAHILEGFLVESFDQKEHCMVKYVRMDIRSFEGNNYAQAEYENRSMKSSGGTNPMFALVISLDAMLSKTQQRYIMKLCKAGKDIISVPLWSKKKGAKDLTKLGEGIVFMEWSGRDQYFYHASFSNGVSSCENGYGVAIRKIPWWSTKIHPPWSLARYKQEEQHSGMDNMWARHIELKGRMRQNQLSHFGNPELQDNLRYDSKRCWATLAVIYLQEAECPP